MMARSRRSRPRNCCRSKTAKRSSSAAEPKSTSRETWSSTRPVCTFGVRQLGGRGSRRAVRPPGDNHQIAKIRFKEEIMTRRTFLSAAATSTLAIVVCTALHAASPAITYTTIYVQDMHCGECAKTIARKLYAIPGVVEVRADVTKNIAYVVPQKDKTVASKAVWEAVESAGFRVVRVDSPQGSY